MRDDSIMRMHEANVRRVMLLLRQFEFLETKIRAYEYILSDRWSILKAIWNPIWMKRCVDNKQKELLSERKRMMDEVIAKPKLVKPVIVPGSSNGR